MSTTTAIRPRTSQAQRQRRAGRPRHTRPVDTSLTPREQILDACVRLFVEHGFFATSTRMIAEEVGIRQASLYYHFADKHEILAEILQRTVRPTVDNIDKIEQLCPPETPETVLHLLVLLDVRTLTTAPHNSAFLALLPEVTRSPAFTQYEQVLAELTDAYDRIGAAVQAPLIANGGIPTPHLGSQLLQLVEVVIKLRKTDTEITDGLATSIAGSCLRLCGATTDQVEQAAAAADELMGQFDEL